MYTLPVLGRAFVIKNLPVEYGRSFRDLFNFMEDREVLNGQTASSTSGYVFQISKVTGGEREGILNGVMTRVVDGEVRLDEERRDELITSHRGRKIHTRVPAYDVYPLPNHLCNLHPSFPTLSLIASLITGFESFRIQDR